MTKLILQNIVVLILVFGNITLPGLVLAQNTGVQNQETEVTEEDLIDGKTSYIKGLEEFENGNYESALDLLNEAYVKLPRQAGISFALSEAYLLVDDLTNAAFYGKQATQLEPENKWYRLKLASIYRQMGRNQATIDQLNTALEYHPKDEEILFELANVYTQHNEFLKSNEIYNRLLKVTGPDIGIHLQKLRNFNELGIRDSSIAELKKIQQLDPDNLSTLQLLSNFYQEVDKSDEAKTMLREALEKNPRDPKSLIMLSDIYVQESQWDSVSTLLGNVITDKIIENRVKLDVARYLYSQYSNQPDNEPLKKATGNIIDLFVEHEPQFGGAHALAADFYMSVNNTQKALPALEKTNELHPDNEQAWLQRLELLLQQGRFDDAIEAGKKADRHIPQDPFVQFYIGSAYLQKGSGQDAITYLKEATQLPARREFKSIFYGSLGDSYSAIDNWEQAFGAYEQALKLDPNNATVLNNYAYYLSLQDLQLDKAEEMSLKALQMASGENAKASYLDTVGWVYFKKGDYEKARNYIKQSIDTGASSAEVLEHMGDVMDKLNKPEQAKIWWEKALEQDPSRTYLKEKISQ